jgi:tetratricopeptide (TPR) repeat protein
VTRHAWTLALALAAAGCASSPGPQAGAEPEGQPVAAAEPRPAFDAAAALERGKELEKVGRPGDAGDVYREALQSTDLSSEQRGTFHLRLARIMADYGRTEVAIQHAQEAVRQRPDWSEAAAFAKQLQHRAAKEAKAKTGKAAPKGETKGQPEAPLPAGGDVAERLARIEKMLTAVVGKLDAGGAKSQGGAGDEALQKKIAGLKETTNRMEKERNELKGRVKELEREVAALREEAEALRKKLAETK